DEHGLTEEEYIFQSTLRYGFDESEMMAIPCAKCDKQITSCSHGIRCVGMWGKVIQEHDALQSETYHFFRSLGCVASLEERKLEENSRKRMDVWLQFDNKRKLVDFRTLHPLTKVNMRAARKNEHGVFEIHEQEKIQKYEAMAKE